MTVKELVQMGAADCYGPSEVELIARDDGSIVVRSPHALAPYPRSMTDRLDHWAAVAPDRPFLAARDGAGAWRHVTYAEARIHARAIAQALIDRGLSAERPVAILSGNGIEHALLGLGAMTAGIPYASISPPYSLVSSDFSKLRAILGVLTPGLVFAESAALYGHAIAAAVPADVELVVSEDALIDRPATPIAALMNTPAGPAVDAAHAAVGPDTVAKLLFTSGSTGAPKGVINTQRMLTSNQAMIAAAYPTLVDPPPVLVDWLPWSHTFGANHNFGIALMHGGTLHIDRGKPMPDAIGETVRNLREIAPTVYYNVPKGYEMLLPFLREDAELRRSFFSRLQFLFYAGASLAGVVRAEYEAMAVAERGERIPVLTSLGSTETAPSALSVTARACAPGVVGIPNVGIEMKLVPSAGKLEARIKGPSVTPGYWRRPDLTAAAFDDEGFYHLGDALRFADPDDPEQGFVFDGRIAEDFKLATGTWVSVGPLRARAVEKLSPLIRDLVIAGHDRDDLTALLIPDLAACRSAFRADASVSDAAILGSAVLRAQIAERLAALNAGVHGSSFRIERALVLTEPPSIDAGEVTDKGSINQRAVIARRAALVEELYADELSDRVILPAGHGEHA
ncbi:feruloyl-CoA synthase [Rhodoplanes sp. SY1]|uniref:feruloyl-CoA synthase n=1 Tax=Rhodoplanes sp. SY1 TaxID=3166646 RepID=UPI0038B5399E